MQDFAALLLGARTRAGLTQAQVAIAAGLTPSYLSFIENRKKPPPSDEVCQRLAEVLDLPAKRVLEVAHMERAPEALQKRVKSLTHALSKERKSRRRALENLLTPFLFRGPPGWLEATLDKIGMSRTRQKRIRQVLAAVGRHNLDREKEVSKVVDELPDRDRALLLEMLPALIGRDSERAPPAKEKAAKISPTASSRRSNASGAVKAPELFYEPPDPDARQTAPYLLEATPEAAATMEDVRAGDLLLVDPQARPGLGDLLVLRGAEGYLLRRLKAAGAGFQLAQDRPRKAGETIPKEELDAKALAARIKSVGAGAVTEVRRPLRKKPPPSFYPDES
ncbi:MAG: helix-turn-helix domain-containing protein [Planctomycetota bacterium]|jgi:transcriptional regulator with XRE-family HTH domain